MKCSSQFVLTLVWLSLTGAANSFVLGPNSYVYSDDFDGSSGCVVAYASATTRIQMFIAEVNELVLFLEGVTASLYPIDELLCTGPGVVDCFLASADLDPDTIYNILIFNPTSVASTVKVFQASLDCPSYLLSGGSLAAIDVASGSYVQSGTVSNTRCSNFTAVSSSPFSAGLYNQVEIARSLNNSSYKPIAVSTCSSTGSTFCQIQTTSLDPSASYSFIFSPSGQGSTIFFSTKSGCLGTSFVLPAGLTLSLGPLNKTSQLQYQLQSNEPLLSAVVDKFGYLARNTAVNKCSANIICNVTQLGLDNTQSYYIVVADASPINNTAHLSISVNLGFHAPAPAPGALAPARVSAVPAPAPNPSSSRSIAPPAPAPAPSSSRGRKLLESHGRALQTIISYRQPFTSVSASSLISSSNSAYFRAQSQSVRAMSTSFALDNSNIAGLGNANAQKAVGR